MLLSRLREQHRTLSESLVTVSTPHNHPKSPIHRTLEEDGVVPVGRTSQLWQSVSSQNRSSISTILSGTDGSSVWYDANSGDDLTAEEYVLKEDEVGEEASSTGMSSRKEADSSIEKDRESQDDFDLAEDDTPDEKPTTSIDRRNQLPSRPPAEEGSLFSILKKNVGQVGENSLNFILSLTLF